MRKNLLLAPLAALAFLLPGTANATGGLDDPNMGQTPPVGATGCNITEWSSHVFVDGKWSQLETDFTWLCDEGYAYTFVRGERFPTTSTAADQHCRSHVEETKQKRPHKTRYVTRLLTDCDHESRALTLHKTKWHKR